eukprot:jgi/Mesvir1/15656/Mv03260-RA.1
MVDFEDAFDAWERTHNNVTCDVISATQLLCMGTTFDKEQRDVPGTDRFYIDIAACVFMVCLAGICSGLTLGLLSLDTMNLEVILKSGSPSQRSHAQRIMPLVRNHHLLLCTLLLANAAAMEALPIFLDRLVGPLLAVLFSVTAVLIFGEVLPQAVCSRYGLAIGAHLSWLVWTLVFLLSPVAWPLSKALDCLLGKSHGSYYKRAELRELVGLHSARLDGESGGASSIMERGRGGDEGGEYGRERDSCVLTAQEATIIRGALDMRDKRVKVAMTPLARVFSLPMTDKLNAATVERILASGHSRVPVYRSTPDTILGVLMVKKLIGYDLQQGIPIMELNLVRVPHIAADMRLSEALSLFRGGKSHLAVVVSEQDHLTVLGIVTLEDVLEELLQVEILDETDLDVDVARGMRVPHAALVRPPSFPKTIVSTHAPLTHAPMAHTLLAPGTEAGGHIVPLVSEATALPTMLSLAVAAASPGKRPHPPPVLQRSVSHPGVGSMVHVQLASHGQARGPFTGAGEKPTARGSFSVEAPPGARALLPPSGADQGDSHTDWSQRGGAPSVAVSSVSGSGAPVGGWGPEHTGAPPGKGAGIDAARVPVAVRPAAPPVRQMSGSEPHEGEDTVGNESDSAPLLDNQG